MSTVVHDCESLTGWSLDTNGVGTKSVDSTVYFSGSASIKYVRTVDKERNYDSTIRLNLGGDQDWSDTKKIRIRIMCDKSINNYSIRLLADGSIIAQTSMFIGNRTFPFQTTQTNSAIPANTWFEAVITLIGADLSTVNYFDLQSSGDKYDGWEDGETVTLWIDSVVREEATTPSTKKWCVVDFDDGYKSVYQNAFPIMQARNQKGTFSIVTNAIDGTHYLGYPSVTSAEVLELHNAGWDIGAHSHTHANLETASQASVATEIDTSSSVLESITGQPPTYMSLPFNAYDEVARVEAIRKYKYIGRGNTGISNPYTDIEDTSTFPLGRPYAYELTRFALSEEYNHEQFVRIMNDSYNYGRLPHLTFHSVADDGSPVYTTVEKFTTVMDWLFNNGWSVVPATQMYGEIFKSTLTIKTS